MRCDQCNKFAAYDDSNEPEIASEDLSDDGAVAVEARIYLTCADCGQELKEATFDFNEQLPEGIVSAHTGEGHELEMEVTSGGGLTSRQDGKPGTSSRYRRTFYGLELDVEVFCACLDLKVPQGHDRTPIWSTTLSDDCQASAMDELV